MAHDVPKKRKRPQNEDDDSNWSYRSRHSDYSSSSGSAKKIIYDLSQYIPTQTSNWTIDELDKVKVKKIWVDKASMDLFSFFGMCLGLGKKLDPLDSDLIILANHLKAKLKLDVDTDSIKAQLVGMLSERRVSQFLDEKLAFGSNGDDIRDLMNDVSSESALLVCETEAGRNSFIQELRDILYRTVVNNENLPERRYTYMLDNFCRMCNFKGRAGEVERSQIKEVDVVAVPDLTFTKEGGIIVISLAEVKRDLSENIRIEDIKHQTESADESEQESKETVDLSQIKGLSQHVGQLIVGLDKSAFLGRCFGLLLNKTKIMITCLLPSINYSANLKTRLEKNDQAELKVIGPYDLLKADDRNELIEAFLMLGREQRCEI